jgi:hypothetical protein
MHHPEVLGMVIEFGDAEVVLGDVSPRGITQVLCQFRHRHHPSHGAVLIKPFSVAELVMVSSSLVRRYPAPFARSDHILES